MLRTSRSKLFCAFSFEPRQPASFIYADDGCCSKNHKIYDADDSETKKIYNKSAKAFCRWLNNGRDMLCCLLIAVVMCEGFRFANYRLIGCHRQLVSVTTEPFIATRYLQINFIRR